MLTDKLTEATRVEGKVALARDECHVVFNSITDGITVVDRDFRIVRVNAGMANQTGLPLESLVGRICHEAFYGKSKKCEDCIVEETIISGQSHSKIMERVRSDGSVVCVEVQSFPVFGDNGEVEQVIKYCRDITEKKSLEQQLLQAQKMESIGVLAGGIAHDFNNLLSGILGYASLLKTKTNEHEASYKYVETIEQSAIKAARLINQLLAFSRTGKSCLEVVDINEIITETLQILERAIDKNIDIRTDLTSNLWALEADPSQIEQVLLNIFINARDAMPNGGILAVKTENIPYPFCKPGHNSDTGCVRISISDTGQGIAKDIQNKIFDPFFTTKDKTKGTGLGLAVVYGIVKNHCGLIRVESELNQGAKFEIQFPASRKKAALPGCTEPLELVDGHENILLVDDEEVVRNFGKEVLEAQGYHVSLANNGLEAVEIYKAEKNHFDLVVLDVVMPKLSGVQAFEKLKMINPDVQVIFSSGYNSESQVVRNSKDGCQGFIKKPYTMSELTRAVRQALKSN